MLKLKKVSLRRGQKVLLDQASITLPEICVCGIIGRNGAGKSSMFSMLRGEISNDGGEISLPSNTNIAAMEQELPDGSLILLPFVCAGDHAWSALNAKLEAATASDDYDIMAEIYDELAAIDGYTIESRAAIVLSGLGFTQQDLQKPLSEFSGGWQMRAQLARVLMSRADVLLLDEPTNHLDLETVSYLESWLKDFSGTALVISHDREFLDSVSTHTLHLASQKLKLYAGNYTSFSRQFQEALILQGKMEQKIAAKRAHMEDFVRRFKAKASKAKQAQSRMKALEKLEFSAEFSEEGSFHFSFLPADTVSYPAIQLQGDCGYPGKTVFKGINISFAPEDRIGIIGVNGAGKTTLLKSLAGELAVSNGDLQHHQKLNIAYYSQQQVDMLDLDQTPVQVLREYFPRANDAEIRGQLGRFAFSGDRVNDKIKLFSGGERARLALAILVWKKPNFLILDEPTNHLDMQMREALIAALQNFSGTVLLVSHDRYLLECVCDQLLVVADGAATLFNSSLDDYTESVRKQRLQLKSSSQDAAVEKSTEKKSSNKQDKAMALLESEVAKLQSDIDAIDKKLADQDLYCEDNKLQLAQLQAKREELVNLHDAKQKQWLEGLI
jgi:ATP-binding cassette, subfamily F, member 3